MGRNEGDDEGCWWEVMKEMRKEVGGKDLRS